MLRSIPKALLGERRKRALRSVLSQAGIRFTRCFRGYSPADLKRVLAELGVKSGDTLFVQANFSPDSGFSGTPGNLVSILIDAVGPDRYLLMASIPLQGFAYDRILAGGLLQVLPLEKTASIT